MYIFQKVEKVDTRAVALLCKMEHEMNWRRIAARRCLDDAMRIGDAHIRATLYRNFLRLEEEAREIEDAHRKLEKVLEKLH